jgi:hypothetical protein
MYDTLKDSARHGTWKDICRQLGICESTVSRYIEFYLLIHAYPRLLICHITFETIMYLYKGLMKHIDNDNDLAARLGAPLRTTYIKANIEIDPETLPRDGPHPIRELPNNVDWNGGWEIGDDIIEKKQDAIDESSSNHSNEEISRSLNDVSIC